MRKILILALATLLFAACQQKAEESAPAAPAAPAAEASPAAAPTSK